jgi:hypothetical protein
VASRSKKHHYLPVFYQRNFANPMFSDRLNMYSIVSGEWHLGISPADVGRRDNLYTTLSAEGELDDSFERVLARVDAIAAPAIRVAAVDPASLHTEDRRSIAVFIALQHGRSPREVDALSSRGASQLGILNPDLSDWMSEHGIAAEFAAFAKLAKRPLFDAVLSWANTMVCRFMLWPWLFLRTGSSEPFVTSDYPLRAERDPKTGKIRISFPVSSEVALCIEDLRNVWTINLHRATTDDVAKLNRRALRAAEEFVICSKTEFPGNDYLPTCRERAEAERKRRSR